MLDSNVFESRKVFTEAVTPKFGSAFVANGNITEADLSNYILQFKAQYLPDDKQQSFKIAHLTRLLEKN